MRPIDILRMRNPSAAGPPVTLGSTSFTGNVNYPQGYVALNLLTAGQDMTLTSLCLIGESTYGAGGTDVIGMLYASASPGAALLRLTNTQSGITAGENVFTLASPLALPSGTSVGIGFLSNGLGLSVKNRAGGTKYWFEGDLTPTDPVPAVSTFSSELVFYAKGTAGI